MGKRAITATLILTLALGNAWGLTALQRNGGEVSAAAATPAPAVQTVATQEQKTFTKAELKKYDGKNGHPAYIAANGIVYDVSHSPAWKGGKHKGKKAGTDVTTALKFSPHGSKVLKDLPIVGKLAQ